MPLGQPLDSYAFIVRLVKQNNGKSRHALPANQNGNRSQNFASSYGVNPKSETDRIDALFIEWRENGRNEKVETSLGGVQAASSGAHENR